MQTGNCHDHDHDDPPSRKQVRKQASDTLKAMGLSISDAVRVFLTRIATEQQISFALRVPNTETRAAMEEARAKSSVRFARPDELFDELEKAVRP